LTLAKTYAFFYIFLNPNRFESDENKKYMRMTKDATLEGSSEQANKDLINRRNGQGPKHLKFFLLVFSKDEAQT